MNITTVYTYGGGKVLDNIYNAIAVIYQDGYMESFLQIAIMLGLALAGIKAAVTREGSGHMYKWFGGYLFVILVLLQPVSMFGKKGMTMYWRDVVTGEAGKVDHLPPGFVVPAGVISGIGYSMAKLFETLFSKPMPEYLPYSKYGTTFASQVRADLRDMRIQDPVFAENLESYIDQCVKYDVMIGMHYDIKELLNEKDIWDFLDRRSSNLRMFNYRHPDKGGRELLHCRTGLRKIQAFLHKEMELVAKKFPSFTKLVNARAESSHTMKEGFKKALELTGNFYGNLNGNGEQQLRQILFINQFKTNPHSYGTMRTMQSQNSNWMILGDIGQLALPILHAIFQALIHASFPIVVTLAILSQRYQTLRTYFELMVWIELWPLLFAILNGAVSIFAQRAGLNEEITIDSINKIVNTQSMYAMMAYGMGLSIPAFAYMLSKGGVSQFVHMASSLTGSTQQGVSIAASEVTTGNRSLDNVSIGNRSYNNVSANKQDTTGVHYAGFMRTREQDGAYRTEMLHSNEHGGKIYESGAGMTMSKGSITVNEAENDLLQYENRKSELQSEIKTERDAVNSMQSQVISKAAGVMARNYDNIINNESFASGREGKEGQTLSIIANNMKKLIEDYNYTKQQAGEAVLGGSIKGNANISPLGKNAAKDGSRVSLGVGGEVSLGGNLKGTDTDKQSIGESQTIDIGKENRGVIDDIITYSKKKDISSGQGEETAETQSLNSSYDELRQKQKSLEYHENEQKLIESSIRSSKGLSMILNKDLYQSFLDRFAEHQDWTKPGTNIKFGYRNALDHIEKRDEVFNHVMKRFLMEQGLYKPVQYSYISPDKAKLYNNEPTKIEQNIQNAKNEIKGTPINNEPTVDKLKKNSLTNVKQDDSKQATTFEWGSGAGKKSQNIWDSDLAQKVNKYLDANQNTINTQKQKTNQDKNDLEKKVDGADDTIKGFGRKLGVAGTPNQFVKKRKGDGGKK